MDVREVHSFREVLPQQAIGVFIRTTLPGTSRIAKIDLDVGVQAEALMLSHLTAAIPGQRFVELAGQLVGVFDQCVDDGFAVLALYFDQHDVTRMTFNQGRDLAVVATDDQVALPVTRVRLDLQREAGRSLIETVSVIRP